MSSLTISIPNPCRFRDRIGARPSSPRLSSEPAHLREPQRTIIASLGVVVPLGLVGMAGILTARRWWRRRGLAVAG
jgi:hypothetical protein